MPGVVVCGALERWVSIYLQQVRALNLAWALTSTARPRKACVVGGGFAGLTVAAGLARRGVAVTLLERDDVLLAAQRTNRVRWIHPHIHDWPRPGGGEPRAGLPVCDWSAALSADVAAQVLAGFTKEEGIDVVTGALGVSVDEGPRVAWRGQAAVRFDLVVLALGLGIERSFGALPL